jgi:hypothetical protein
MFILSSIISDIEIQVTAKPDFNKELIYILEYGINKELNGKAWAP